MRSTNDAHWKYAELYSYVSETGDFSHSQMAAAVQERYQVRIHDAPSSTKLRRVWQEVVVKLGVEREELRALSPWTMYELLRLGVLRDSNIHVWMGRVRNMTRSDLIAMARGEEPPLETSKLVIDANVGEMVTQARKALAKAAGYERLSETAYQEFVARLILETKTETLRELWRREHGE